MNYKKELKQFEKKLKQLAKFEEKLEEYFSNWAVEAGEEIEKKAEKEKWTEFDYTSAINFMLADIRIDIIKMVKKLIKDL